MKKQSDERVERVRIGTFRVQFSRASLAQLVIFIAAYVCAGGLGQGLAMIPGVAIPFWPPAGIFVAMLLLNPTQHWSRYIAAAGVAELVCNQIWLHNPLVPALCYFSANVVEATLAAGLVLRFTGRPFRLETVKQILAFIGCAAFLAPIAGATITASIDAVIGKHSFATAWILVWSGDASGLLVSTPLTLMAAAAWRQRFTISGHRVAEFSLLMAALVVVASLSFHGYLPTVYTTLPILLWCAIRFQTEGAATSIGVLTLATAFFTAHGKGVFAEPSLAQEQIVMLQAFLAVSTVSVLCVGVLSRQCQLALDAARDLANQLESRVAVQAAALRQSEEFNRTVLESSPDCLKILGPDGTLQFMNANGQCLMEIDEFSPVQGAQWGAFWPEQHRPLALDAYQKARRGDTATFEAPCPTAKGTQKWWDVMVTAVRDAHGVTDTVLAVSRDVTLRKEAEIALFESAQALKLRDRAIEASDAGILIVDALMPDLPIVFASDGFYRLTGYTAEECRGKNCRFLQGLETNPNDIAAMRTALQTGQPIRLTLRNYRKDGTPFWNDVSISPVTDDQGRITHFVGVQNDATAQRDLASRLKRESERLALGIQVAGLALTEVDYQTGMNHLTSEAAQLFGLGESAMTVPRSTVHATFHPDDIEAIQYRIAESIDPAGPGWFEMDHRVVWPTGEIRWLRVRKQVYFAEREGTQQPSRAMIAAFDVTAEKVATEQARASAAFIRGILDSLPESVVVLDSKGIITAVNAQWTRFAQANGASPLTIMPGADYLGVCRIAAIEGDAEAAAALRGIEDVITGRRDRFTLEYPCHSPDEEFWFLLNVERPLNDQSGAVLSHIDITSRKRSEEKLRRTETKYRAAFELANIGQIQVDPTTGRYLLVNDAFCEITGRSRESLLNLTPHDIT